MTKSEQREVNKAKQYTAIFEDCKDPAILAMVARTMGTLVRSTRSDKARRELVDIAEQLEVYGHSDYIVGRWS